MKKYLSLSIALFFALGMLAEAIPAGFYDGINGKKDADLKTALNLLVRGGERYEYGSNEYHTSTKEGQWQKGDLKWYGTWQAFPETDMHPDGIIWDMYSNATRYYPNKRGDSGCSLNIEHCLPKSWWGWNKNDDRDSSQVAYKDLFNLNPSDAQANSQKSNYAPGEITEADKFDNGSFRMTSAKKSPYGYICYAPEEQYRGDFARTYFYMVTAYEHLQWSETYAQYVSNESYLMLSETLIDVLLAWHRADPVSDKEICRADRISSIQHNRNPFIDYPELIEYIWGNKKGQAINLSSLSCTAGKDVCPEPIKPEPEPVLYDTLINLPGLTKAIVNAYVNGDIKGEASEKIQSNGSSAITMGASTTDGYLTFTGLSLKDTAILIFRASPYDTGDAMQLDIYADNKVIRTINEEVVMNTRNEVRYRTVIPAGTKSIKIESVGGSTKKRACMQELYLLKTKSGEGIEDLHVSEQARKEIRDGRLVIIRDASLYTPLGQIIQ